MKSYNFHIEKQDIDPFSGKTVMPVVQWYEQLYGLNILLSRELW